MNLNLKRLQICNLGIKNIFMNVFEQFFTFSHEHCFLQMTVFDDSFPSGVLWHV